MKLTNRPSPSTASTIAMCVFGSLLLVAALPAQAQYLELATTGIVNPQSGIQLFSICADFNNNGTDDILYVDGYVPWCSAIMDPGVNGFAGAISGSLSFPGGPSLGAVWGFAAELTGDGNLDLVLLHNMNNMAVLYPGLGTGTFAAGAATILPVPLPSMVVPVDFNNDGVLDLALLQAFVPATTSVVCLLNQYPVWTTLSTHAIPNVLQMWGPGDCDGDSNQDLILIRVNASNHNESTVLWGLGNGSFAPLAPWGTSTLPFSTICYPINRWVGDSNGDGRDDVLVGLQCPSGLTGQGIQAWQDQVYLGNSNRTFTPGGTFTLPATYGATSAVSMIDNGLYDMDLDGNLDLVCNPVSFQLGTGQSLYMSQNHILVARGLGGSQFHPVPLTTTTPQYTNTVGIGFPYSLAHVSDFDNDGDLDVLATNGGTPPQYYFRNRSSRGAGCPGSLGSPLLRHGLANVGNALHSLSVSGAAPSAAAVIAVSLGLTANPLTACGVYIDTLASTIYLPSTTNALGSLTWPLPIPNNPLLHGVPFFAQTAVVDPSGPNLGGLNLALSPARTIIVW